MSISNLSYTERQRRNARYNIVMNTTLKVFFRDVTHIPGQHILDQLSIIINSQSFGSESIPQTEFLKSFGPVCKTD